jgi:hypothetical protein
VQDCLVVDFARCRRSAFDLYEQFALLCTRRKVSRVLFKTGAEDAELHYALRDVLATVADILGAPLDIRLALVANSASAGQVYRSIQPVLRALGCEVQIFGLESQASCWLCGGEDCVRTPRAETAVAA